MSLEIKILTGSQASEYLSELAALRIEIFREFPYLYDGDLDYEKKYLSRYFNTRDAHIITVFDDNQLVGASTCMPLWKEMEEIQKPFSDKGLNRHEYFYLGESVLQKKYRGQGVGKLFFKHREQLALKYAQVKFTAFCAVLREINHPMKPAHYRPLNEFWEKTGYKQNPQLIAKLMWKDINEEFETQKQLEFWIKKLR
ncbi:MAG: GNAT family N-acetyltransferase [Bacteroidetes bacterium]|nr:MAG: GNAT family N-acetyltransferase [Bacteroidota bacterium]